MKPWRVVALAICAALIGFGAGYYVASRQPVEAGAEAGAMSPGQQKRLLDIMLHPSAPWLTEAFDEYIAPICTALGWVDELDDDETSDE